MITEDDIDDFIDKLPTVSDVVRAFFATKTLIFLGYDLDSPHFKRLYRKVGQDLKGYRRPAYAVTAGDPDPLVTRYWEQQGVQICVREPLPFLEALGGAVKALQRRPFQRQIPWPHRRRRPFPRSHTRHWKATMQWTWRFSRGGARRASNWPTASWPTR